MNGLDKSLRAPPPPVVCVKKTTAVVCARHGEKAYAYEAYVRGLARPRAREVAAAAEGAREYVAGLRT